RLSLPLCAPLPLSAHLFFPPRPRLFLLLLFLSPPLCLLLSSPLHLLFSLPLCPFLLSPPLHLLFSPPLCLLLSPPLRLLFSPPLCLFLLLVGRVQSALQLSPISATAS